MASGRPPGESAHETRLRRGGSFRTLPIVRGIMADPAVLALAAYPVNQGSEANRSLLCIHAPDIPAVFQHAADWFA